MKSLGTAFLMLSLCASPVAASDGSPLLDTKENRIEQAQRYASVSPLRDLFADVAANVARTMPDRGAKEVQQLLTQHIDMDARDLAVQELMVKHFTAEELSALADFYGSPVGKSAMSKFGAYMADAMPIIQREVMKALQRATAGD